MNDFGIIPASTPIPTTLPKTSGNGFGIIPAPPIDYEKRRKEEERKKLETEARKAQVDAQFASSKVVKVANTIKEFGNETLKDIEGMSNYIVNTYKKTPSLILKDIEKSISMQDSGTKKVIGGVKEISSGNLISGAKDIATGQFERKYSVLVKGVAVPLSRVADAVYSPLSAFIGSALNDSGVGRNVGKIVNNAGEVVADKSGIVDKEKFKLYIAENGEYVEDFLRILDVVSELTGTAAFSTVVKSSAKKEVLLSSIDGLANKMAKNAADDVAEKTLASLTKEERYAKYLKEQGYEGYINPDDLPSIQMGSKDKSSLPTIQIGDTPTRKSNVPGDFTYEPIKNTTPTGTTTMADNVAQTIDRPQIEVPTTTVEKVNKIQKNLNEFESQTNAEQISKIESMDEQLVKDIALGKKPPVDGIPSTAYLAVMENRANELAKNGDYSLALELADSNIGKKAGQNLQAMSIASKDSFTGIIRDIKSTLEERIPKTAKKNQLKEVQSIRDNLNNALNSIDVIKPPKNMIEKALSELICK